MCQIDLENCNCCNPVIQIHNDMRHSVRFVNRFNRIVSESEEWFVKVLLKTLLSGLVKAGLNIRGTKRYMRSLLDYFWPTLVALNVSESLKRTSSYDSFIWALDYSDLVVSDSRFRSWGLLGGSLVPLAHAQKCKITLMTLIFIYKTAPHVTITTYMIPEHPWTQIFLCNDRSNDTGGIFIIYFVKCKSVIKLAAIEALLELTIFLFQNDA